MTKMTQHSEYIGDGIQSEHLEKGVENEDSDESTPYYLFTLVFIFLTLVFPVLPTVIFVLGGLLILLIILLIRQYFNNKFKLKKMEKLLVETIMKIGCQPVVDDNHDISFAYQGENFVIRVLGENFITIWDMWWGTLSVDDLTLPQLKSAINETNIRYAPTTIYSINEENGVLGIHTKYDSIFIPEIPNLDDYLKHVLNSFFEVHYDVKGRFQQLREEQEKVEKNNRVTVKGFSQD